jgi:hypothetical protein
MAAFSSNGTAPSTRTRFGTSEKHPVAVSVCGNVPVGSVGMTQPAVDARREIPNGNEGLPLYRMA